MEFHREYIELGPVLIRYYGIIIVVAMLAATLIAARIASSTGRDSEHVYGALTWAIIPGIIFARLWFILFPAQNLIDAGQDTAWYFENFFDLNNGAIAIWSGGLSIFGALLGGLLGALIYFRKNRLPVGPWLDIAAIVIPVGQAIGRWANYVNRELYGTPTGVNWWGLDIPIAERPEVYRAIEYFDAKFHPLFLYESLWSLAAFGVLLYLYNRYRDRFNPGDFFLMYIAQYTFIRFMLEFIRVEVTLVGDVNVSQVVTGIAFVVAVGLLLARRSRAAQMAYPAPTERERPQPRKPKAKPAESTKKPAERATRTAAPALPVEPPAPAEPVVPAEPEEPSEPTTTP